MATNVYLPQPAKIVGVRQEAQGIKTFTVQPAEGDPGWQGFVPGQFLEATVFGVGEAPFSISSAPGSPGGLELTVAAVGEVTEELHGLAAGDVIGVRGPYGRGFPVEEAKGRRLFFVAGGIGLAPLRSLIAHVMSRRNDYGEISILYGARNPGLLCFREDLAAWEGAPHTVVRVTVDSPDTEWRGPVGTVASLLGNDGYEADGATAFVCGPPVMIRHTLRTLLEMGFAPKDIITTLERRMECGVGKCGHCTVGRARVCVDGPVFSYAELLDLEEGF